MNVYHRKVYALLKTCANFQPEAVFSKLQCLADHQQDLQRWWDDLPSDKQNNLPSSIASSSDRINLELSKHQISDTIRHPISGQTLPLESSELVIPESEFEAICNEPDPQKVFWWLWRFLPELERKQNPEAFLLPAHPVLPDCPQHSYRSTVSALVGAMYPDSDSTESTPPSTHPYLLIFTFSPVQEFIKASRKFLDFWAGSYLLHYLSVKLCWKIAQDYGPDAIITPSLWSQEIIDALLLTEYGDFEETFKQLNLGLPVEKFDAQESTSLATAGFPNVITALIPESEVEQLGNKLKQTIRQEWKDIADKVRQDVKTSVMEYIQEQGEDLWKQIKEEFPSSEPNPYREELQTWKNGGCWEWNQLWDVQIENTWETYWTAIPLGNPEKPLSIEIPKSEADSQWKAAQEKIIAARNAEKLPTKAEEILYESLNVGTWWGALQARLGQAIQSVKNTRTWRLGSAPGERSTLSGQFSALHPRLLYTPQFREGAGLKESSMRLFWTVMAQVYPGVFNGSEKLNALELSKRMAWSVGGVANSLGITNLDVGENGQMDYEKLIRFPNLSSIAAARFAHEHPERLQEYWSSLRRELQTSEIWDNEFYARICRPFQVPKTDQKFQDTNPNNQQLNGVMFSSKWLADDLGINQTTTETKSQREQLTTLRQSVESAHRQSGFNNGSPADWWVIVLADGDSMGKYVSGRKLKYYENYLIETDPQQYNLPEDENLGEEFQDLLKNVKKRMGPATHVALNRALLDFSNRLVPALTEKRFCGKVVYSGGDDVMAVLPLSDLPEYILSIRAAWSGKPDPKGVFENQAGDFESQGGYWKLKSDADPDLQLDSRHYFTMGEDATLSMGIVIAYKTVPLPTVLENLWSAEKDRAKKLVGKDGLCFRVIYGGGNVLESLMKGELLDAWWDFMGEAKTQQIDLSPLLYRLAEELPRHACVTEQDELLSKAAQVILTRREQELSESLQENLLEWINQWDKWAFEAQTKAKEGEKPLGTDEQDLAKLLRFSAFWLDKELQTADWGK